MPLSENRSYFVSKSHVYLRKTAGGRSKINHLLLGDWLSYLGETKNGWARVKCRGDTGWLKIEEFGEKRALEINFVDIGQGDGCHIVTPDDDIILIDAGVGTNMNRFLSWRYNLRNRNVEGAPDFDPEDEDVQRPWKIEHVVISHPDNDHYLGLSHVFANPKLTFGTVYHNGIVERPPEQQDPTLTYPDDDDLGGYAPANGEKYVWGIIDTSPKMKAIIEKHRRTRKQYLSTLRACLDGRRGVTFKALSIKMQAAGSAQFMGPFDDNGDLSLQVLGPITERITHNGETRHCLRKLGDEGVTKNGHSVILKLRYNKLAVMLGGDLNTQAQDFLLQHYTSEADKSSTLEKRIAKLEAKGEAASNRQKRLLATTRKKVTKIVDEARPVFECDVTKACHHGSSHFTDTFLKVLNPVATVISSGDEESHSHPRPDAIGAFGKHARGSRPLIFSTELARSTKEFTPIMEHFKALQDFLSRRDEAESERERRAIERDMEKKRDHNVVVYGMITLRALGDHVIIAQKLEKPRTSGTKWDIYDLVYNPDNEMFEYHGH